MRQTESAPRTLLPGLPLAGALIPAGLLAGLASISPWLAVPAAWARIMAQCWILGSILFVAVRARTVEASALRAALAPLGLLLTLFVLDVAVDSPQLLFAVTASLLALGALAGGYIGGLLRHPGMLLVVAYVASVGDCFSVYHPHGLTHAILQDARALSLLALSFPALGSAQTIPLVGVGDVVFACVYMVGTRATGLSPRRTFWALLAAMTGVVLVVELAQAALPALPFMSSAVVLAHPEARRLPAGDARRIAANLAFVTALLGVLFLSAQREAPGEAPASAVPPVVQR